VTAQAGGASPSSRAGRMAQPSRQVADERRRLRGLRRALSREERRAAERRITATLRRMGCAARGRRVALYLARDGEVDLAELIRAARRGGARLYAPHITSRRRRTMRFLPLRDVRALRRNWYGIDEPEYEPALGIAPSRLDVILTPLVGFDRHGHRLGMGAGYYDRALRRRLAGVGVWRRPRIVGVAFACQETGTIAAAPWDVPLDLVVTERGVLRPARGSEQRTGCTT
jgi:5-formyltetrahydrofolate cyclo-ligase